jgi:predicted acetyltransferase
VVDRWTTLDGTSPSLRTHYRRFIANRFSRKGQAPAGFLSFTQQQHEQHGTELVVQEFWAADRDVASAMFEFLGRHNSTIDTIKFERASMPPYPVFLHNLRRNAAAVVQAKPGWMLRILDVEEAVRLRGWPSDLDVTIPLEIGTEDGGSFDRYALRITSGAAELSRTRIASRASFTRQQFAVWYAGGYRTVTAAQLSGVGCAPDMLSPLIRATADREPWMSDHF